MPHHFWWWLMADGNWKATHVRAYLWKRKEGETKRRGKKEQVMNQLWAILPASNHSLWSWWLKQSERTTCVVLHFLYRCFHECPMYGPIKAHVVHCCFITVTSHCDKILLVVRRFVAWCSCLVMLDGMKLRQWCFQVAG